MASKPWRNSCCNPFNKVKHSVRDIRTVSKSVCEKFFIYLARGEDM